METFQVLRDVPARDADQHGHPRGLEDRRLIDEGLWLAFGVGHRHDRWKAVYRFLRLGYYLKLRLPLDFGDMFRREGFAFF